MSFTTSRVRIHSCQSCHCCQRSRYPSRIVVSALKKRHSILSRRRNKEPPTIPNRHKYQNTAAMVNDRACRSHGTTFIMVVSFCSFLAWLTGLSRLVGYLNLKNGSSRDNNTIFHTYSFIHSFIHASRTTSKILRIMDYS